MFTDHEDYRFIGFSDPREAMLSYAQSSDGIDLVLTDYSMPNHSGDDVARHFRSLTPGIPIIGMSSDPGQFDPSLFDLTMAKTVVREHLTDAMHRVLRGAK